MAQQKRKIIFDWDGVLSNSLPAQWEWYQQLCKASNLPFSYPSPESLRSLPQESLGATYTALGFNWARDSPQIWKEYHAFATPERAASIPFYEGIPELLQELQAQGTLCAIASANTRRRILPPLQRAGITSAFAKIVAYDDLPQINGFVPVKPHPQALIEVLQHFQEDDPRQCIYVGDQGTDIQTVRNLAAHKKHAMPIISTAYGYTHRSALELMHPDAIVNSPQELASLLKEYIREPSSL